MSKELKALERLYCAGRLDLDYVLNGDQSQDYKLIETALKEKETLTETFEQFVGEPSEVIYKKLKALEIIKEKRVDIPTLLNSRNAKEHNRWVDCRSHYTYRPFELTEEEFDLLKAVLLCGL